MRRYLIILARTAECLLITFVVLELLARLDQRITNGAPFSGVYNELSMYGADEMGRIGKPNAQYLKWKLNSTGYRGPELRKAAVTIACIGSSETFGVFESPDHEYPRQLEQELNKKGADAAVVNVAYPGMVVATAGLRVPYMVSRVKPNYALIYPSFANYIWLPWLKPTAAPAALPSFELRIGPRIANIGARLTPERLKNWRRQRSICVV